MNLTDAILQKELFAVHYTQKDTYLGKKLKSYTGKEVFDTMDDVNKLLTKNGFKPCDSVKYDAVMNVGSLTTYAIIKQVELYSYDLVKA